MQGGIILGITGSFGNLDASGRFKQVDSRGNWG